MKIVALFFIVCLILFVIGRLVHPDRSDGDGE